jgi:hypothetical protein
LCPSDWVSVGYTVARLAKPDNCRIWTGFGGINGGPRRPSAHAQNVYREFEQALRFNPKDLIRTDLGVWGFEAVRNEIDASFDLMRRLQSANRSVLPAEILEPMAGVVATTRSAFERIMGVGLASERPGNEQEHIVDEMRSTHALLFKAVAPYLPFIEHDQLTFEAGRAELLRDLQKALEDLNEKRLEGERALESIRKAATTSGIVGEAKHFSDQADEHKRASRIWAVATVLLLMATAGLALYSVRLILDGSVAKLDTTYGVQLAIGKLLLFSVLFTAIVGNTRSYRSNRHNYVVNKHRANALATFQAFVQGASHDPAVKSAFLLQATTCVFSPQPTAYGIREVDAAGSQPLVEMAVKALASAEK